MKTQFTVEMYFAGGPGISEQTITRNVLAEGLEVAIATLEDEFGIIDDYKVTCPICRPNFAYAFCPVCSGSGTVIHAEKIEPTKKRLEEYLKKRIKK